VKNNQWVTAKIYAGGLLDSIRPYSGMIQSLARARPVTFLGCHADIANEENALVMVMGEAEIAIPMESMIDLTTEKSRLQKEIEQIRSVITQQEARLSNVNFLAKAPGEVINKEKEKLVARKSKLERLEEQLSASG
jgi:valyl-tRNA synthetase